MRRALYALLALAALSALVAACGDEQDAGAEVASVASVAGESGPTASGDTAATGTDTELSESDRQAAMLDFARCMRAHGVQVDDPKPGQGLRIRAKQSDGSGSKLDKAQKACDGKLKGAIGEPSAEDRARMRESMLKFARCMREHGIDLPDPKGEEGIRIGPGDDLNPDDPAFKKAEKACDGLLRDARGGEAK